MFFEREMIDRLKANTFELDCSQMRLVQDTKTSPLSYSGPGRIWQSNDGELHFKLYAADFDSARLHDEREPDGRLAGKFVPRDHYYTLEAVDFFDRHWLANNILPHKEVGTANSPASVAVTGDLYQIEFTEEYPLTVWSLRYHIFDHFEIPCNNSTQTETTIADYNMGKAFSRNVARFDAAGSEFLIRQSGGEIQVDVHSRTPFSPAFEKRVIESLQFVLARTISWRVLQISGDKKKTTRLASAPVQTRGTRMVPPIQIRGLDWYGATWIMFDRFLSNAARAHDDQWIPASAHLYSAREASANTLESQALGLSVAIEGTLRDVAKDLVAELPEIAHSTRIAVESLREHARRWGGVPGWNQEQAFRQRIDTYIQQILQVRPIDILYRLVALGAVREDDVRAWKRLRNTSAHAETPGSVDNQGLVDRIFSATVLLYHILFHAIGYTGKYTDYATPGFPIRVYPSGTLLTSREAFTPNAMPDRAAGMPDIVNAPREPDAPIMADTNTAGRSRESQSSTTC